MMSLDINVLDSDSSSFPDTLRTHDGEAEFPMIRAIGNLQVLDRSLLGFFCSKRCPGDVILCTYDLIRMLRNAGVPLIGGFHTSMEKDCLELLLRGKQLIVICPYAAPQSQTERLCREIIAMGKDVYTFDSENNAHLFQPGLKPFSAENFPDYIKSC